MLPTDFLKGTVSIYCDLELLTILQIVPVQFWNTLFSGMDISRTSASCLLMHHYCCLFLDQYIARWLHQKFSIHVSNLKYLCGNVNWGNGLIFENLEQRITGCGRLEFQSHSNLKKILGINTKNSWQVLKLDNFICLKNNSLEIHVFIGIFKILLCYYWKVPEMYLKVF